MTSYSKLEANREVFSIKEACYSFEKLMLQQATDVFDNLDDKFLARLREISSNTRTTTDGKATITFKTARIEANYSPDIIRKIEAGRLIAIPNVMGVSSKDKHNLTLDLY